MHYLVRFIGEAPTANEANANAQAFADDLVERGTYDYYDPYPHRYEASGTTVPLTSDEGQVAVIEALAYSRTEFMKAIGLVRRMLEAHTDEAIYQDNLPPGEDEQRPSRFDLYRASGHAGTIALYGDGEFWGEAIRNDADYAESMEGIDQSTLWVTSLDMHQ
ncbi:MAG: hypothetical protein H0U76_13945 [Ktedonobacteraceae bacterium]|nr:hypothetical protein [Ktedonobacteraceae bacterium]